MIDLLRFIGLVNAAVWFGSAVYHMAGVGPVPNSDSLRELLGPANAPYFAGAIDLLLQRRLFWVHLVCGSIALLHIFGEWIYLGRSPRRSWAGLLAGLFALNLLSGMWLQSNLARLHTASYAVNFAPDQRQAAHRSFKIWNGADGFLQFALLVGTGIYFWRISHPAEPVRFTSSVKFRS